LKILHRNPASRFTQGTPAGFPSGIPGIAAEIDGAIQHAPQFGRQEKTVLFFSISPPRSEMPPGKSVSAAGFQISFKRRGFFLSFKSKIRFHFPRYEFRSMWNIPFVMLNQTQLQIFGTADVTLGWMG